MQKQNAKDTNMVQYKKLMMYIIHNMFVKFCSLVATIYIHKATYPLMFGDLDQHML